MFRTCLLLLCVSLITSSSAYPADVELPDRSQFHLFLLVGQSNMAGRGKVEPEDQQPHPRILSFNQEGVWEPAVDPLHFDKPPVVGVGLGRSFARAVAAANPQITIGLIPCAAGGSPIDSWRPGGFHSQTNSHPYDDALRRARQALQDGTLRGILWHQGESDARPGRAGVYADKLHELVARFRRELDAEHVPFIAGQLGRFADRPWDEARFQIDRIHRDLPTAVSHAAFVSSKGLNHKGDKVHFDSPSYRELGRRYAMAYLRLQTRMRDHTRSPVTRLLFGSCIKQNKPIPILQKILNDRPDLFVFLGDNIYADTTDMQVMQDKYDRLGGDRSFQQLLTVCPTLATWDDHDYGANDAGASYSQREAAQKLFVRFWGDDATSPRYQRHGVYDSRVFGPVGKRLQVILLDTRYFRGELKTGPKRTGGPYLPATDKTVPLLGEKQWQWLEEQLRVPAELRVIASSIQCVPEAAGQECWANLPHERERLFQLIQSTKANGVVIISGDRHWAEISEQNIGYPLIDITSSSLNQLHGRGTPTVNSYRADTRTFHRENYGVMEIDWDQADPLIGLKIVDLDGAVQIDRKVTLAELAF